jgi:beta-lactam-binding protein with PASTA domain
MLDKGQPVKILVSTGPPLVVIPGVQGLDPAEAVRQIEEAGFRTSQTRESSVVVNTGLVIGTNPAGGTEAPKGSTVVIKISTGPPPTTTTTTTSTTTTTTTPTSSTSTSTTKQP